LAQKTPVFDGLGFEFSKGMGFYAKRTLFQWAKMARVLTALAVALASNPVWASYDFEKNRSPASINRGVQALATPSKLLYNGETLISADLIENYRRVQAERRGYDVDDFIPTNLQPSDDSSYVMAAIADKSLNTVFNRPEIRESALGRAATRVEKSLNKEVVVGGNSQNDIEHRFNFQLQAFQSQAQLRYDGITHAALSYQARSAVTSFEVFEKILRSKEVVVSHELRPDQRVSQVSLRWSW
jgi:hypothetical protein